jgi:hypothetical protein
MPDVPQIRLLNYNGEDIGMGFNSDTGLAIGTALDFSPPSEVQAQEAQADVKIITSHEELMETLNMSASLEGRYSFVSGGGKVSFSKNTKYNSSSTFVVASMVIRNTVSRGKDFRLKPELQHYLTPGQIETFNKAFGDSFVRAHYQGGEFYAVMRLTSVDSKTESNLAVSLQMAAQGLIASADFHAQLDTANSNAATKSEFTVNYYQKGGAGENEIGTTMDVEEIKKRLKSFPEAIRNHAFPYTIEVATYDTVPIPIPSKKEEEEFLNALADANTKELRYIQLKNDFEFAAEKPEFFYDPPAKQTLLAAASTYTQLVNATIEHAKKLSDGSIDPPKYFDPASLTPPIIEPGITLRKRDLGLESGFANWWMSKEKPETRKNDKDLVTDIGYVAIPQVNNFNDIADPGAQAEALARVIAQLQSYSWDHAGMHDSSRGVLTSLEILPGLLPASIKTLGFPENEIASTKGLDQFLSLVSLDLSHNQLSSIDELAALKALRTLTLVDNQISDISALVNCPAIETLDLSGNDIKDLEPLAACKKLKNLTIEGSRLVKNGVTSRWTNPIVSTIGLETISSMANPFLLGRTLQIRYGVLSEGADHQFTGTASRVGNSNQFRVHLTCGAETMEDVWALRAIQAVQPITDRFSLMFLTLSQDALTSDLPLSGVTISVTRRSVGEQMDLNYSYVDPEDSKRAIVDPQLYPGFATRFRAKTFDAVVID